MAKGWFEKGAVEVGSLETGGLESGLFWNGTSDGEGTSEVEVIESVAGGKPSHRRGGVAG